MSDSSDHRYARQIQFAAIGDHGQKALRESSVAVLGCGALGSVASEILARAGVGKLLLIDRDVVEWTNLQRQSLYDERDAKEGDPKANAAANRLREINSEIELESAVTVITPENIRATLSDVDLVIDASDNFAVRFLLNDWSLETQTPWGHGGCVGATGQVCFFRGEGRPCFRCVVPEPPPAASVQTCDTAGVIGSATHLIASLQTAEAIKWLSGNQDAVRTELLSIDLWGNRIRDLRVDAIGQKCAACVERRFEFLNMTRPAANLESVICGRDAVQISNDGQSHVSLADMAQRWNGLGRVQKTRFFVRLHLDAQTVTVFRDGRTVIEGTSEISQARVIYDRFVGS